MEKKTMADVAYDYLLQAETPRSFKEIYDHLVSEMNIPEAQISRKRSKCYSELSMDSRFLSMADNTWGLRRNFKFDEVHLEPLDLDDEDEEEEMAEVSEETMSLDLPSEKEEY